VLEIAIVRAIRPDLDAGVEALAERVDNLERSQAGGAAFPRPGAPAVAPAPSARAASGAPAAPPPAPAPTATAAAAPADPDRRPSIGALRRRQGAEAAPAATAEPVRPAAPAEAAEAAEAAPPAPVEAASPRREPAPPAGPVDRDSLTEAWGDGILRALPARVKALYSAGRFVTVTPEGAQFALPNAAHRDRCAELVPRVEDALSAHFGTPVRLVLVVDDAASAPSPTQRATAEDRAGDEDVDPADLRDDAGAVDQTSAAEARLLEAFPGASEVV
jgi:DNA polymerase-3 subunit gamma/tau